MIRCASVSTLSFLLFACSAGVSDDATTDEGTADQELRTGGVDGFTVRRSAGFMAPPTGGCVPWARYTVNLSSATLSAEGCFSGQEKTFARSLDAAEVASARAALTKVRTTKRPTSCPTDVPVLSLDVSRGTVEQHYAQKRSACSGATPVTDRSIAALFSVVEGLASATSADAGPSCVEGSSCSQAGAWCGAQCTDPCQFCNRLICSGSTWERMEVFPMPPGQCGNP